MGFTEILTIIFVFLKAFGVITWSWWLVFLPEIIAVALYVLIWSWVAITQRKLNKRIRKFIKKDFNF